MQGHGPDADSRRGSVLTGAYCASLLAALIGAGAWVAARRFVDAMQRRLEFQEVMEALAAAGIQMERACARLNRTFEDLAITIGKMAREFRGEA